MKTRFQIFCGALGFGTLIMILTEWISLSMALGLFALITFYLVHPQPQKEAGR